MYPFTIHLYRKSFNIGPIQFMDRGNPVHDILLEQYVDHSPILPGIYGFRKYLLSVSGSDFRSDDDIFIGIQNLGQIRFFRIWIREYNIQPYGFGSVFFQFFYQVDINWFRKIQHTEVRLCQCIERCIIDCDDYHIVRRIGSQYLIYKVCIEVSTNNSSENPTQSITRSKNREESEKLRNWFEFQIIYT